MLIMLPSACTCAQARGQAVCHWWDTNMVLWRGSQSLAQIWVACATGRRARAPHTTHKAPHAIPRQAFASYCVPNAVGELRDRCAPVAHRRSIGRPWAPAPTNIQHLPGAGAEAPHRRVNVLQWEQQATLPGVQPCTNQVHEKRMEFGWSQACLNRPPALQPYGCNCQYAYWQSPSSPGPLLRTHVQLPPT